MKAFWSHTKKWRVITPFLKEKPLGWIVSLFAAGYLALSFSGISIWRCFWREFTGWRCPGCGLTTGCKAFLRGDFREGVAQNWFVPVVLCGMMMIPLFLALPVKVRARGLRLIECVEARSRVALTLAVLAMCQIVARLGGWA